MLKIERLTSEHDRRSFSCGVEELDQYFREQAGQDSRRNISRVFVACDDELGIVGYYTLNVCSLIPASLPGETLRKLPKYSEIPGVFVGRLARDLRVQGRHVGELLMIDVFRRAQRINDEAAVSLIVLDSKDEGTTQYYGRYGFSPLVTDSRRLFVPLATVIKAYSASLEAV